jgi:arginine/lysine/ornithine decarboxylase
LEAYFSGCGEMPDAVYVTSPDYLGNLLDISALAEVCHRHGVLLLVDNAHGAYLKFLPNSQHPMDLGADLCCDSAHKTLPVLTGGAYLHIRDEKLAQDAKDALALFGSTSPSYLILQSLDAANAVLNDPDYLREVEALSFLCDSVRQQLQNHGLSAEQCAEPWKITLSPRPFGYTGTELAEVLRESGIECEFADPDFLVLMLTPAITGDDLQKLVAVLTALPRKDAILTAAPVIGMPEPVMTIRQAMFSSSEVIPVAQAEGRILSAATVGCPPAVPIVVCGERIDKAAIEAFQYYGIETCRVCK